MNRTRKHAEIVDSCIARLNPNASAEQLAHIFDELVKALWVRSSRTLSEVTLDAIFERALHMSKEKFPILNSFKLDPDKRRIDEFHVPEGATSKRQLTEAFRYFLVMILTLFGNLTADILLSKLYRELQIFSSQELESAAVDPSTPGLTVKGIGDKTQAKSKERKA